MLFLEHPVLSYGVLQNANFFFFKLFENGECYFWNTLYFETSDTLDNVTHGHSVVHNAATISGEFLSEATSSVTNNS